MWTLDATVCIALLKGDDAARQRLLALAPADVALSAVVRGELAYGARNSGRVEANLRRLIAFLAPFASLPFDERAADHYGRLRAELRREGTPVGGNEMLIAATALANDAVLVTRNRDEFLRIAGLRVELW